MNVFVAFSRLCETPVWVWPSRVVTSSGKSGRGEPGGLTEKSGMCPSVSRKPFNMALQVAVSKKLIGDPPEPRLIVS